MVYVFEGRNINKIYRKIYDTVESEGKVVSPRGKETLELNPVVIKITNPRERFCSARPGFNLPFSIAEVLWILEGRGDAKMITHYLKGFGQFLDEGYDEFNGAYGNRIRRWGYDVRHTHNYLVPQKVASVYEVDQLEEVYKKLKADPDTRQAVMMLWNPAIDNGRVTNDTPCNNWSHLMIRDGKLNWTQVIRSNDLILGTPQNIFQFTMLQEILAGWLDVEVGHYIQMSDSLHLYKGTNNDGKTHEDKRPSYCDIYEIYDTQDARLPKDIFDMELGKMSDIEEDWRKGDVESNDYIEDMYWTNFMQVLSAYNCVKYGKIDMAIDTIESMTNEYRGIMKDWLKTKVKK